MTKSYIIEENIEGFEMELSVYDNEFLQFVQTITISYGTLYSYLHSFNISVEDENNKIKITNNTNNKYKILLKNSVLDLVIVLYQEDVLSPTSLFDSCAVPIEDDLLKSDAGVTERIEYSGIIYLKNITGEAKEVSIEFLGEETESRFNQPRLEEYVSNASQNDSILITQANSKARFCLAPNRCPTDDE